MATCQYMHPQTGERCDKETDYTIQVGPVRMAVCEGQHAKDMAPGGRNKSEMRRLAEEYDRKVRRAAQGRSGFASPGEVPSRTAPRLTWPKVEQEQGS